VITHDSQGNAQDYQEKTAKCGCNYTRYITYGLFSDKVISAGISVNLCKFHAAENLSILRDAEKRMDAIMEGK
jgi:hypothetical protein